MGKSQMNNFFLLVFKGRESSVRLELAEPPWLSAIAGQSLSLGKTGCQWHCWVERIELVYSMEGCLNTFFPNWMPGLCTGLSALWVQEESTSWDTGVAWLLCLLEAKGGALWVQRLNPHETLRSGSSSIWG